MKSLEEKRSPVAMSAVLDSLSTYTGRGINGHPLLRGNGQARPRLRVAMYSHDTMGLGHMRQNLLIAQMLAKAPLNADILLLSEAQDINRFHILDGIDAVALPALHKNQDGRYRSRRLRVTTGEIVRLRSSIILTSVKSFQPDVLIVDNVPRGTMSEMEPVLEWALASGRTRCVLGLRDVLDEPEATIAEWRKRENEAAIERYYDEIWVYGDPNIYDLGSAYDLSAKTREKIIYTGYPDPLQHTTVDSTQDLEALECCNLHDRPYNLCMVGGGQDGHAVALAFAQARQPGGQVGVILTGPFMKTEQLEQIHALAQGRRDLMVCRFTQDPMLFIRNARAIVTMGGYNSTMEILRLRKPALIVPRVTPRREQQVRADSLDRKGLVDTLHPRNLQPEHIGRWLERDIDRRAASLLLHRVDFKGLERIRERMRIWQQANQLEQAHYVDA